jgi:hypothetical protein
MSPLRHKGDAGDRTHAHHGRHLLGIGRSDDEKRAAAETPRQIPAERARHIGIRDDMTRADDPLEFAREPFNAPSISRKSCPVHPGRLPRPHEWSSVRSPPTTVPTLINPSLTRA